MKSPKGFGRRYFSLASILAFSVSVTMASQTQSLNDHEKLTFHKKISKDDKAINEDEPIVISKKVEVKEVDAPFASEIYTQRDIKNSHSKDLYDFIDTQTSLNISSSYGNSFAPRIDMRGYGIGDGYENIAIMLDGRKLNNIDMQPQLLSSIPLKSIKRIEILKGSGSVEYGDGANAGVINIITKDTNGITLNGYVGSYGLWHSGARVGIKKRLFAVEGFIDKTGNSGDRIIAKDGTKDDSYNTNKGFKLTLTPMDKLKLHIGKTFSKMDIKYPNALTLSQYNNDPKTVPLPSWGNAYNKQHYKDNVLSYGLNYILNPHFSFDFQGNHEDKLSNYITYNSGYTYKYNSYNTQVNYSYDTFRGVFGIQNFNGKRVGTNVMKKDNLGYFFKNSFFIDKDTISFGARRERVKYTYSSSASNLQDKSYLNAYDIGYNHKLNKYSSVFANFNHSFETPDVDRFFSYDFINHKYIFNSFIKPSKVNNFNIGYNYFKYPHKLKIDLFYANVKNEIYYNAITWQNTNLDKTKKYGFELQEKYNIHYNLFAKINYAYINTKIKKDDLNPAIEDNGIPGVSKHNLKISIGYNPNYKTTFIVSQIYRSKAYAMSDFDKSFGKMQSYNSTNLSLNYRYKNVDFFAKVNNIFDRKNALFVDNGMSIGVYPTNYERTFLFGASVKF